MIKLLLITLLFSAQAPAKPAGDKCHVYVADQSDEAVAAIEKAMLEIRADALGLFSQSTQDESANTRLGAA